MLLRQRPRDLGLLLLLGRHLFPRHLCNIFLCIPFAHDSLVNPSRLAAQPAQLIIPFVIGTFQLLLVHFTLPEQPLPRHGSSLALGLPGHL
ncbi:hypothetical protein ACLB2K_046649 [Fragaria x ananassa]